MMSRLRGTFQSWLSLLRPANVVSAPADVLAGWCIAGASNLPSLTLLAGASMCLYAGGVALNDVCDARLDAKQRPERPIPSGAVNRRSVALVALALLILGVALAWGVSMANHPAGSLASASASNGGYATGVYAPGLIALALAMVATLYDAVLKRHAILGPMAMGACRSLNLALGLSFSAAALAAWWPATALVGVYIAGVTVMARSEADEQPQRIGVVLAMVGLLVAVVGWGAIALAREEVSKVWMLTLLILFAAIAGGATVRAWRHTRSETVKQAVATAILGLALLDGAIAAGFAQPVYGVAALALLAAAALLGRRFTIT